MPAWKKQALDAKNHLKSNKKRRKKNLKTKEQTEEDKRKDVARMTAELARLDQEDARQEKLRKKRQVKKKKLREQLRNSTDDDVVMDSPLSPHQLSTAKGKVVDYIASNIPFIQTRAHVVQVWDYNAEHSVAPRGDRSRSADSAAKKAALVDKTIVDKMATLYLAMKPGEGKNCGTLTSGQSAVREILLSIASKSVSGSEKITMMVVSKLTWRIMTI